MYYKKPKYETFNSESPTAALIFIRTKKGPDDLSGHGFCH